MLRHGRERPFAGSSALTRALWIAVATLGVSLASVSMVYAATLDSDELRSHLPYELQVLWGHDPFSVPRMDEECLLGHICFGRSNYQMWTHEAFLRSSGGDITDVCYREYLEFADGIAWIEGDGYWNEFHNLCERWLAEHTSAHLAAHLPGEMFDDCKARIAEGWVLRDDGTLGPGDGSDAPGTVDFVGECIPIISERPSFLSRYLGQDLPVPPPAEPPRRPPAPRVEAAGTGGAPAAGALPMAPALPALPATGATVVIPEGNHVPGCEDDGRCYWPPALEVAQGTTVTWLNSDRVAHTVTSGSLESGGPTGAFDSGLFMPGAAFAHTFGEAGEFSYYCVVRPWMGGAVIVR